MANLVCSKYSDAFNNGFTLITFLPIIKPIPHFLKKEKLFLERGRERERKREISKNMLHLQWSE